MDGLSVGEMSAGNEGDSKERNLRVLYLNRILTSIGDYLVSPFLRVYAVMIGASTSELGFFTSMSSLSSNVLQIFFGRLTDRLKKRVPLIAALGIASSLIWGMVALAKTPETYIWLIVVRMLLVSALSPASMTLMGDLIPVNGRGVVTASLNFWTSLGGLAAIVASGIVMTILGEDSGVFTIPLVSAAALGILAYVVLLAIKESPRRVITRRPILDVRSLIADVNVNPSFRSLCATQALYVLAMSIAWPVFPVTMVKILNASMFDVSLASVASIASSLIAQRFAGRLCDRVGRKPLITLGRFSFIFYPVTYMFAPSIYAIIAVNFVLGFPSALFSTALLVFLLDNTADDLRGELTAFYNLSVGLSGFIGSLVGGVFADYLLATMGLWEGCATLYAISAVGRLCGAYLVYRKLEEPRRYPSTLRMELMSLVKRVGDYVKRRV